MAVAVATVATKAPPTNANHFTCNKPTSLAVGDLMVAMHGVSDGNNPTLVAKSDWNSLAGVAGAITIIFQATAAQAGVQWKIADSGDVAASSFTWPNFNGGASDDNAGLIWRITGHDPTTPIGAFNTGGVTNSANPSFGIGITPPVADCLLLFCGFSGQATSGASASNYAIVTSNPTWTENLDTSLTTGCWWAASASRTQTTLTGNASMSVGSAGTTDSAAALIAIQPAPSGPANLKSLDTNAKANIKSYNTNPIANIKSIDTNP
jgi:hypothetical protein